jgi:large subunit ribosomal protein L7Ae
MVEESRVLQAIEAAKSTGKIRIGTNEATKAVERGIAKLVVVAEDVQPREVVMHLGPLCDEKKIAYATVKSKTDLGRAAGIEVSTAAIAIVEAGDAKKIIDEISKKK